MLSQTRHSLIALAAFAAIPAYADTFVQGAVFAGSTIFDTGQQTGSPISDLLTWNCGSVCSSMSFTADGQAKVVNGSLGVTSTVSVTGNPGVDVTGHSIAHYKDTLTVTNGTGAGVLVLQFGLDGSITETAPGAFTTALGFGTFGSSIWQLDGGAIHSDGSSGPGLLGDGTKSDTVTFYIPFNYGTAFDLEFFMATNSGFVKTTDSAPYTATVDFYNTAKLNSALVFNGGDPLNLGPQNNGASIGAGSGLQWGANGITASTPEPATWMLVAVALGVLAYRIAMSGPQNQPKR